MKKKHEDKGRRNSGRKSEVMRSVSRDRRHHKYEQILFQEANKKGCKK